MPCRKNQPLPCNDSCDHVSISRLKIWINAVPKVSLHSYHERMVSEWLRQHLQGWWRPMKQWQNDLTTLQMVDLQQNRSHRPSRDRDTVPSFRPMTMLGVPVASKFQLKSILKAGYQASGRSDDMFSALTLPFWCRICAKSWCCFPTPLVRLMQRLDACQSLAACGLGFSAKDMMDNENGKQTLSWQLSGWCCRRQTQARRIKKSWRTDTLQPNYAKCRLLRTLYMRKMPCCVPLTNSSCLTTTKISLRAFQSKLEVLRPLPILPKLRSDIGLKYSIDTVPALV